MVLHPGHQENKQLSTTHTQRVAINEIFSAT